MLMDMAINHNLEKELINWAVEMSKADLGN